MRLPGGLIGEACLSMGGQLIDDGPRQACPSEGGGHVRAYSPAPLG
jgi:hypothetical protein